MANSTCWFTFFTTSPRHVCRICGRAARTSAPHTHGRQFDIGRVYGQAGILEPWWSGLDSARIGGKTKHENRESNVFALKRPRRTFPASLGLTTADTRKILEDTVSCAFGRRGPWEARSETWVRNYVSSKLRAETPQHRCGWGSLGDKRQLASKPTSWQRPSAAAAGTPPVRRQRSCLISLPPTLRLPSHPRSFAATGMATRPKIGSAMLVRWLEHLSTSQVRRSRERSTTISTTPAIRFPSGVDIDCATSWREVQCFG